MKRRFTKFLLGSLFSILSGFMHSSSAQVTMNPPFATESDNNVVLTYDASLGNSGLLGESTIYAHTGVITDKSTSSSDWKYVVANWTTNLPKALLTRIGSSNQYTLNIGNIRSYYNVPSGETILKIALVFRNADGSKTGKTSSGGDIFIDINQGGFDVKINKPSRGSFFSAATSIAIIADASEASDLTLYANGQSIATNPNATSVSYTGPAGNLGTGRINLVAKASKGGVDTYDSSYFVINPAVSVAAAPANTQDGINYIDESTVTLQLFAPNKDYVYVIGDFTNWEYDPAYQMKRTPDGDRYWLTITGLTKNVEYGFQYSIDDIQMKVADVYADKYLDPWNDKWIDASTYPNLKPYPQDLTTEVVSVLETGQADYTWQYSDNFVRPKNDHLVIYEVLVRDFIGKHDFKTLKDTISYFKRIGINCVQLMPIMEFEGNESWGYNPAFYFAVDKYYGHKDDFKAFVDECHKNGIAVVLDIALNHSFGSSPQVRMYFDPTKGQYGQPTPENPWFNETDRHPYGVGFDYNHEAQPTKDFVDRIVKYWLTEYHVDGYRFDLSKGFTQKNSAGNIALWSAYDQTRIDLLNRMRNEVIKYDPTAYLILEHLSDNSEEVALANAGFMMWGIMTHNYAEATMGYNNGKADLSWGNYKTRGYNFPNLVTYAESHDEERIMYTTLQYGNSNGGYSTKTLTNALPRIAAYHAFLIPLKGPKMIWQGAELGYDVSIETNGRTGNKPFKWEYLNQPARVQTMNEFGMINRLKQHVSFESDNYTYDVDGTGKIFKVFHDSMNTVIVGNFDVVDLNLTPTFPSTGWWYNYISGDSMEVTDINQVLNLKPGQYFIYTDRKFTPSAQGPSSIGQAPNQDLPSVFPNPTHDHLYITTKSEALTALSVYSAEGRLLVNKEFNGLQNQEQLTIQGLTPGMYLLKIQTTSGFYLQKVIVQ